MAKITAIINQKGGVGKTTTALALADTLRACGRSVLLIDFDQQHNATRQYGALIEDRVTVYDLLCTDGLTPEDLQSAVQKTKAGDIIPGDPLLAAAEAEMASITCRETRLADVLEEDMFKRYSDIIIDCSPSLGTVSTNALVAADAVIVPVLADRYSVDGMKKLAGLIRRIASNKRLNPKLHIEGFLVCQYEGNHRLTKSYEKKLPQTAEEYGTKVFETCIRRSVKVKEAQDKGISLFDYAPTCNPARDYVAFCKEYLRVV